LGAEIKGRPELFDAGQYSFFGDSDVGNGTALDGALEVKALLHSCPSLLWLS
jgi:hypothetical protein